MALSRSSTLCQIVGGLAYLLFVLIPGCLITVVLFTLFPKLDDLLAGQLTMEQQALHVLAVLRNSHVALETKLDHLTKLKTHIKHHHVPEPAINPAFEVVRFAISTPQFTDAGFSILSHLTKRLELQEQLSLTAAQGKKIYPIILERLGDAKDRVRLRAIQGLTELWKASPTDVEQLIRDSALAGKGPRAKEAAMQWIIKMNIEFSLQFKSFVSKLVDCLQDTDGGVRDSAKSTIVELFLPASEAARSDLRKQLEAHNVRKTTVTQIYTQLGLSTLPEVGVASSNHPRESESSAIHKALESSSSNKMLDSTSTHKSLNLSSTQNTLESSNGKALTAKVPQDETMSIPAVSQSEMEAYKLDPIYVSSSRELDEMVRSMLPFFEGKESEDNWIPREKSIIKLRRITKGNAPLAYNATYILSIKLMLEGILKTVNSLRTTVSTNGCHLIQDVSRAAGSGLDGMVEILLQSLIKLCGGTKTISAQNGNETVDAIFAHVTFNIRLMQHIWVACQDKNVRPRSYATGWLKTLITKHGHHKSILEHANGLDIIDKCIRKGLADANPGVRENMRATYWAYWLVWSDRADSIMQSLDIKQQGILLKASSNPDPSRILADSTAVAGPKAPILSRSATSAPRGPSLKETIAARKKEARQAERPGSAQSSASPTRPVLPRPATSMAIGSLASAPLRPARTKVTAKKANSPAASPLKPKATAAIPEMVLPQRDKERLRTSPSRTSIQQENIRPARPIAENGIGVEQATENPKPEVRSVLGELPVNQDFKLIQSGIRRVRAATLDPHGFRQLQRLLVETGEKWPRDTLERLFWASVDHLHNHLGGLCRTHVLKLVRTLLTLYPDQIRGSTYDAVETFIFIRQWYEPHSRLVTELDAATMKMVDFIDRPDQMIRFMSSCVVLIRQHACREPSEVEMALQTLCSVMHRATRGTSEVRCALGREEQRTLGGALLALMESSNSTIRRLSLECLIELHDMAETPVQFWEFLGAASGGKQCLIYYYLAVRQKQEEEEAAE